MPRDFEVYLADILEAAEKVERYTAGLPSETWTSDDKTLDAVVRNLEVIGEAVKQLPEPFRQAHPEVEWKKIAGLRDILIHAYFGIDEAIVRDIVANKLPTLARQIKDIATP